ncbi:MAG: hypothetical protein JO025_05790 [Verrucomicrobia bacterium]|nr:hypothetical protein [Verrucomicrobiota bacterium]
MEPVLTLTYYAQLREQMHSWISWSAEADPAAVLVRTPTHLLCVQGTPHGSAKATVQTAAAGGHSQSPEVTDLDEAFEAMTEKIDFHWPKFSRVHRIKAGLIESVLGLLLFLGLILLMEGLWH